MNPRLEGYTAAVLEAPGADAAALADDLAAVERAVLSNGALRSALTDTAVPGAGRRAVIEDLLADRVAPDARRIVGFAAEAVPAPEVPSAIGWTAQRARLVAESRGSGESPLGHSQARERVGGFAAAQFEGLDVRALEEVEDELFRFARVVESTPELRAVLTDPELPAAARRGVVRSLLSGRALEATVRLVEFTVVGGRARDLVGTLDWLVERTAQARGWRVARVRSAGDVDGEEREQLVSSLSRLAGQPVELQVTQDPALLAGVLLEIGDLQVDATAIGRLRALREHLSPANWHRPASGATEGDAPRQGAGRGPGHQSEGAG
ncbi:MAG TPA: F0F1 ATP synthase subunit delta [Acidimicrobiales bacterium]